MTVSACAEASVTEKPGGNIARPDLCGGRRVTDVPTAEMHVLAKWRKLSTDHKHSN